jgi:two-component system, chemotaxis family, CheB/CheR fusion protein
MKRIIPKGKKEIPALITQQNSSGLSFPVVAIGASAGGLEALEQFFNNMPIDSGVAFVVIQHLDPTHAGVMPELLQRTTSMCALRYQSYLQSNFWRLWQ